MKNVFYFQYINKIGGIETWFHELAKKYKDHDITIYYKDGDPEQIARLRKYVRCVRYTGQHIVCDKMFFCFNREIIDNVEAKEYNLILHGDYKAMVKNGQLLEKLVPYHEKINHYYGVSQVVCDSYEELKGIKPILAYNPIEKPKPRRVLNLISATRLTKEKGKERLERLARMLDDAKIPYIWTIFTDDANAIRNPHIIYMPPRLDIIDYIANADLLVQLSDNEGYCYSVVEALSVGTGVVVTDMPVMKEIGVEHGVNGWIVDFDMQNVPIKDIYEKKLEFEYTPKSDTWGDILEKGESTYLEELDSVYEVEALDGYRIQHLIDGELGFCPEPGHRWKITYDRLQVLLERNLVKVIKKMNRKEAESEDE